MIERAGNGEVAGDGGQASWSEFRGGWPVVLSAFLGVGLGLSPLPFYTMGIFAPHLATEFGWQRDQVQYGLTMTMLMVLWAGPVIGLIAKRLGVRRVALASLVLFGLSFMALALSNGSLTQFYFTWALVGMFGAGTLPITWTRAVNGWFDAKRGMALGLSLMGTGLFGFGVQFFLPAIIAAHGWRVGYAFTGFLPLAVALPCAYFLFHDRDEADHGAPLRTPGGLTTPQTLRDWRFWLMVLGFFGVSLTLGGVPPNLPDILTKGGLGLSTALRLTSLIGLSALVGRVVGGWLIDRLWAPLVALVILGAPVVAFWILGTGAASVGVSTFAIVLIGFALGVEFDLMAYMLGRYFGLRSYTINYAILYGFFSLGAGLGPPLLARAARLQGDYGPALNLAAILLLTVTASLLLLGRYRIYPDAGAAAD